MTEDSNSIDDLSQLLKTLYAESDRLSSKECKTLHLTAFVKLCSPQAKESENWIRELDAVKTRVNEAWAAYSALEVTEKERTAETVAGHKILVEGLAGWLEAVDLCKQGEFESAQEAAVEANRLLIIVQKQGARLNVAKTARLPLVVKKASQRPGEELPIA